MSWPTDIAAETVTTNSPALLAEEDELFVFGYECKIFRDDEKADWIDKEKHLIPWMGDPNILIDRYDGRGALMDLRSTDVAVGTQGCANVVEYLEEENAEVEKLCEEERYRDLHEDEEYDESAYQEEEFKRLQQAVSGMGMVPGSDSGTHNTHYSAIGYSYDANKGVSMGPEPKKFNEDLPYVQPVGLYIPSDIKLPTTMKSHAIIEKTAKFIAEQGNQMEIILKTKQSTNPQFDFLGYYDTLNPYYKYLVLVIKTGEYKPADVPSEEHDDSMDNDLSGSEEDFDTNYLHPSLVKKEPSIKPAVSSIVYKPTTTNSAYSILVSKIKGATPQEQQKSKPSIEFVQTPKEEIVDDSKSKTSPAGVPSRQPHEMPSSQDQLIIEKMANYVVKNGTAFEGLAKTKGDPRFTFLDPQHAFHWYYLNCKERFKAEHNAIAATGSFLSYSKTDSSRKKQHESKVSSVAGPGHTSTLPLSAAGIPIANYASIQSRPTTVSAELVSRIEEIRKKNSLFSKSKDKLTSTTNPVSSACDNVASALTVASATAQRILKRDSKDKPVIKFSSSISQSSTTKDSSTEKDISCVPGDSKKSKDESSNRISKSFMNDDDEVCSKDVVEADSKKKEERRKKAALFLERIKNTEQSAIATEVMKKEAGEISQSDVESVPSPSHVQLDSEETCKENDPAKSTGSSSLGHLLCNKSENEVQDRLLSSENQDRKNGTIGSSHEKKRKGKRSLSSSSIDSSHTDTHHTSSSSSPSRRRRSKRKHSKKRKKKREREKEKTRSHSKKSKRRKR